MSDTMDDGQGELLPDAPIDPQGLFASGIDDVPKARWPKELVRGIEVIESAMRLLGYADDEAFRLARTAMLALADYNGGRDWYLPRGDAIKIAMRDAEIYRRARYGNIMALAKEFGLTDRHIWRIINQQLRLHRSKIQLPLFTESVP